MQTIHKPSWSLVPDNQNFICITDVYGIIYSTKSNSFVTNTFNDFLKEAAIDDVKTDIYNKFNINI